MATIQERALKLHKDLTGKIEVCSKVEVNSSEDLALAYTPGVAEPCKVIAENKEAVYEYTSKGNLVAVVSDGTAVLGLGDIGPEAAMPVMEGKAVLFKKFGNVDAFPICLNTKNVDEIVNIVKALSPTFGGVNLEDIAAPRCFEIEARLKKEIDIPVFHDDQHGTAIIVLAGLINALKIVGKKLEDIKIVINGAGAAGTAIAKLLLSSGAKNVVMCDKVGILNSETAATLDSAKQDLTKVTNPHNLHGNLADALVGADVFIGVSAPKLVSVEMAKSMNKDSIIFAMANPTPEIMPDEAKEAGVRIMGTGRSDFPNQVNNVLAFPGIFRGALDVRAKEINEAMKVAAAYAIAGIITEEELNEEYIIPAAFDGRVGECVARAVAQAARESGVARL